ncbi:FecCD family ABC transporter permease [Macrococcus animalis]|uniref:FecCD family ABC transporter permease n=1 Tax=Macrococcus animalis TaxID=3395467 RepID=UPI0039BF4EB7
MRNNIIVIICIVGIILLSLFYDNHGLLDLNNPINRTILLEIRIPRIIIGILVGVVLSITGYVFQTILSNYLADSFSLGLASGASFGGALAIVLGMTVTMTAVFSIVFSLLTLFIVLFASHHYKYNQQTTWLILMGMFINLFFSSCVYVLLLIFPQKSSHIMNYLFGSINTVNFNDLLILLPITFVGVIIIYCFHKQIEILGLGNDRAIALGVNTETIIYMLLIVTSIMCAILISITGIIGFVGMIIPPFVKLNFKGSRISKLNSILLVAVLMVLIGDFLGRNLLHPIQIPVSIMMCLIGMPILIWVILKQNSKIY